MATMAYAAEITPAQARDDDEPGWVSRAVRQVANLDTILRSLSLVAVVAWTSHAHWELALMLGAPVWLAACLPVAVDAYVLAALHAWEHAPSKRHHDLVWALALDIVAVGGSHIMAHMTVTEVGRAVAGGTLGAVLVLTLWRCRALDVTASRATAKRTATTTPRPVVTPAFTPVTPAPLPHATDSGADGDTATVMARQLMAQGVKRADAVRQIVAATGCSKRTAERRWDGLGVAS